MKIHILLLFLVTFFFDNIALAETHPYWIFFTDRGAVNIEKAVAAKAASFSEPKNQSRRARFMDKSKLFDERDLPVNPDYIQKIREITGTIRSVTRYFNGVTAELNENSLAKVKNLPFVKSVSPVKILVKPVTPEKPGSLNTEGEQNLLNLSYGNSFDQLNLINLINIHKLGYLGTGIKIAVFDSGFEDLEHTAFDSLQVSNEWDFVDGNDNPFDDYHGSQVLSIMAALDKGKMIGAAPYATYFLARTEINGPELRVEEDYWVSAAEWADSLGVDIINSSVGYNTFDDGTGYTYSDLNGSKAIITITADIAAEHGIVVISSAGNEGNKTWHYVTVPADGFNVLAVGSVDLNGKVSVFSSRGPTYDGRIKPDFTALGENVLVVNTKSTNEYVKNSGTSFAAPAVSGAVALILEANPSWGPEEVRNALETTASKGVSEADSLYGYGIIDAFAASGLVMPEPEVSSFKAYNPYPQPFNMNKGDSKIFIYFPVDIPAQGKVSVNIFNFNGENVKTVETEYDKAGLKRDRTEAGAPRWDGTNFTGDTVSPGVYYYTIKFGHNKHTGKIAVIR